MNIKVVYHSTTGNTKKLALAIAEAFKVNPEQIGKESIQFSEPVDLLFIGDGIYYGNPSKKMVQFIDQLNPKMIKNAAVFATYGGQLKIGDEIKRLLQNKGLNVIGEPFTCKGQAWAFLNRSHPDEADLNDLKKYIEYTVRLV
jgi:Uncharacterized flavoproteins